MLLEKSWAKLFNCYTNAEKLWPGYVLEEILGCPTYSFNTLNMNSAATLFESLLKSKQNKEIIVA